MLLDIPMTDNPLCATLSLRALILAARRQWIDMSRWCMLQEQAVKLLSVLVISQSHFLAAVLLKSTTDVCNGVCNKQCVNIKCQIKSRCYHA